MHGVAAMTVHLIRALKAIHRFAGHLDTRDPRAIGTIGRLDVENIALGLRHVALLERLIRRSPNAAVHICPSQGTWGFLRDSLMILVARLNRRQIIMQLHGGELQSFLGEAPLPMRWLIRQTYAQADQVWALTPSLTAQFHGLVSRGRVSTVENVVDDLFPAGPPTRTDRERGLRLLYLSNLLPRKGIFDLLGALRLLGDQAASWELRVIGEAEPAVLDLMEADVRRLRDQGLQVSILGTITGEDRNPHFEWADVLVFPPRLPEGQPLVLLEAMSAGLPVVATRHPGIADTVRDGTEGLLVSPGDQAGLARALESLAASPIQRQVLGTAARHRYSSQYRPERLRADLARLLGAGP